ncbi:hypothetical protein LIER_35728 [Lithospermum erythrorhizon]|uniref:Uncharacterized protein n=1 Tax=Lithospermum erythrorhizon TaxID=34254 RepID=A0AAV3NY38_LITER
MAHKGRSKQTGTFTIEESHFTDATYYQRKKTNQPQPKEVSKVPKVVHQNHSSVDEEIIRALKGLTLPLMHSEKVTSTRSLNPKTYDILVKASYDATKDVVMGKLPLEVTDRKVHGPNETQKKMLQRKGYAIKSSTTGLGYTPKPSMHVLIERVTNYHIAKANEEPRGTSETTTRKSVFQRWGQLQCP